MTDDINAGSELEPAQETITPDIQAPVEAPKTDEAPKELSVRENLVKALKETKENADKGPAEKPQAQTAPKDKAAKAGDPAAAVSKDVQQPKPAVTAPASWSAPAKAKFATLDPVLQNEILKREKEVTQGFSKLDEERNFGKQMKEVSAPYMAIIRAEGGDPVKAYAEYLNIAYQMRTATPQQKGNILIGLAQRFGADLRVNPNQQVNPEVQQLQKTVQQLQWEREQERQYQQQQTQTTIDGMISAFAADPKNVHYETVKADMAALLSGGSAKDLQTAYDMAVWARPDIRSSMLAAQQAQAEADRQKAAQAKVAAARKAGSSVIGSPGLTAPGSPVDRSLRDELRANLSAARA